MREIKNFNRCYDPKWLEETIARLDNRITAMDIPDGGAYDVSADHVDGNGVYAVYAHLMNGVVAYPGQQVSKGQVIGYMGSSGSSTGTHLHLGTFYGGTKYGEYGGGTVFNPLSLY